MRLFMIRALPLRVGMEGGSLSTAVWSQSSTGRAVAGSGTGRRIFVPVDDFRYTADVVIDDKRLFTVQEANELIPFLSNKLQELRLAHGKLELWSRDAPSQQEVSLAGGMLADPQYVSVMTRFQTLLEEICDEGCFLKDLDSGLVDFPTLWEGREVYLCWKLGEPEVEHWHEIEAGFDGRRSLKADFA